MNRDRAIFNRPLMRTTTPLPHPRATAATSVAHTTYCLAAGSM